MNHTCTRLNLDAIEKKCHVAVQTIVKNLGENIYRIQIS